MDRQHVEQLFRQHYRRMYSVASSLLYDEQESKDVKTILVMPEPSILSSG